MENLEFDSVDCAKYILKKVQENGINITATKLLKFLYIFDGLLLAT